jgi:signal peptidase
VTSVTTSHDISAAYARAWDARVRRSTVGRILRVFGLFLAGIAATIAAAIAIPLAFGMHSFTVLSGSMEPTISTGDVIVVKTISPLEAKVGDVVSFRDPDNPNRLLSHRVIQMRVMPEGVAFVTKGDANTGVERWQIARNGTIGKAEYKIPKIGYATNRLGSKFGRLLFLVLPLILLAGLELRRLWSTDEDDEKESADVASH